MSSLFGGALPGMGKKDEEGDEDALKQGNNTGESLLPSIMPEGVGFFGSSYDAADVPFEDQRTKGINRIPVNPAGTETSYRFVEIIPPIQTNI